MPLLSSHVHNLVGQMKVAKILYGATKPFVTTIEASGIPQVDWQKYYDVSEQIPTVVQVHSYIEGYDACCCGVTVQKMPGEGDYNRNYELDDLKLSANAISSNTMTNHGTMLDYLNELIPAADLTEKACRKIPLDFFCRCSKKNYTIHLESLGILELRKVVKECGEAGIDVKCHFCNQTYHFARDELEKVIKNLR